LALREQQGRECENAASLGVEAGHRVLEIGFGNGRAAPQVIAQAVDVRYSGIDISPTMVAEASAFNAVLVAAGKASFHLGLAERMCA
jgi:cyclopropane fatty-acyl-phospholipid synthase-like methyltransferase